MMTWSELMVMRASVAPMMTPALISCFWRSSWSWHTRAFRKRAAGPVTSLSSRSGEKSAMPAVRNWPSKMRSNPSGCKSGRRFTVRPAAVQDEFHRRVPFQGEGQHDGLADEFLPVQNDGDAGGFGGGGHFQLLAVSEPK